MLCEYGCGQEATNQFKNGKWCCSSFTNRCPNNRKKYSRIKSDIEREKISQSNTGRIPYWLKNKTYEEIYGKEKAEELKKIIGKFSKNRVKAIEAMSNARRSKPGTFLNKKHKKETIEIFKKINKKENNPNWRGGISYFPYSVEFDNNLKIIIKQRDANKCQNPECEKKDKRLIVHHIDYDKENCKENNLITLCNSCNGKANRNRIQNEQKYKKISEERKTENV